MAESTSSRASSVGADHEIRVEYVEPHVALVEFERAPHNFFDRALIDGLNDTIERLGSGPDVRAVVLCSTGRNFCAGARLQPSVAADDDHVQYERHLYDAASRFIRLPLPIVAAVQGKAVGGGLGLAMACDFRIAASDAVFNTAFARLGIHQGFGLSVTLPDAVGNVAARRLLYRGLPVSAPDAAMIGLCDEVVSSEDLRDAAIAEAASIASAAPLAVRAIRSTLRGDLIARFDAAVRHERMAQALLRETADARDGITAQRERRAPRFQGR